MPYDLKVVKKTKPEREYVSVTGHQDSHPLLAGMLFGTNSIENNLAIPIKIINSHTFFFFFLPTVFFFFNLFFYLFIAVLGLRFCARAFSSCGKWWPLFIAVRGPLTIAAPLVVEHRLQTRRLSNCDSRAQLLRGMWDIPGPGLKPVSPALAGGFLTTAPPGKPKIRIPFDATIPFVRVFCGMLTDLRYIIICENLLMQRSVENKLKHPSGRTC